MNWLCGPEHSEDDAGARARREFVADSFLGLAFDVCIAHGRCFGVRGATGGFDAATLCMPPGAVRGGVVLPWWRLLHLMARVGLPPTMRGEHAAAFGDSAHRLELADPLMVYGHKKYAPGPHWYVQVLGTRPGVQSRGLGAALLAAVAGMAAAQRVPVYLECAGEFNLSYYSRRGFTLMEALVVADERAAKRGTKWHVKGYAMLMAPPAPEADASRKAA